MRIEFPNSAREDFRWAQAALRIGSAPDTDLVVSAQQGAGHHQRILQDRRGGVLEVLSGAGRVYVNARPVRERALVRPGDILSLGDSRKLLSADAAPAMRAPLLLSEVEAGPRWESLWLSATGAVLALLIALILLVRF